MKLAKSVKQEINDLDGEIDPQIANLVNLMRQFGFNTISSCEGHFYNGEYKHVRPNVIFNALDRGLLHSWIREVSKTIFRNETAPIEFCMFPVWDSNRDIVHEDNWMVWIDLSNCTSLENAIEIRNSSVLFLEDTLKRAVANRPLSNDCFVRSRW